MQLNISGHHVEVTHPLKDYVTSKLEKLDRHHDKITRADVTLTVDKLIQKADARVFLSGADLFADAVAGTCTPRLTIWSANWIDS